MTAYTTPFVVRFTTPHYREYDHLGFHESMWWHPYVWPCAQLKGFNEHKFISNLDDTWAFCLRAIETQEEFALWDYTGRCDPHTGKSILRWYPERVVISHLEWNRYIDWDKTRLAQWDERFLKFKET